MSTECQHDLAERETACVDGMCPLCDRAEIARLTAERDEARLKALGASVSDEGTVGGLGAALLKAERERDEACEGESLRAQERDRAIAQRDNYAHLLAIAAGPACWEGIRDQLLRPLWAEPRHEGPVPDLRPAARHPLDD